MKALEFSINIPKFFVLKTLGFFNRKVFYKGPFATLKLKHIPKPKPFNRDWVLIKVTSCGFCGSDLNLIFLKDSPTASPFTSFPCVIGHEICGEIVEINGNLEGFKIGDLVTVAPHLNCETRGIYPLCKPCKIGRVSSCENFARGSFSPGMFTGICKDVNGGFAV